MFHFLDVVYCMNPLTIHISNNGAKSVYRSCPSQPIAPLCKMLTCWLSMPNNAPSPCNSLPPG